MGAGLAGLDDDVAGDHLDVFVAQGAQHGEAGVVGDAEGAVGAVGRDVGADVGHAADGFEEAAVGARHVGAHVLDEVVVRRVGLGGGFGDAGGAVGHAKDDVEELDERALRVTAAAVLSVELGAGAVFVDDAVGEAGIGHVFAAGEEGSDAVVEDVGVAVFVHAGQEGAEFVDALGEGVEALGYGTGVLVTCCGDGVEHEGDERGPSGFDGDGDEVEPAFVKGAGEGGEGGEVFEAVDGFVGENGLEVPEADACVSRHGGQFEVGADLEEGNGYGLGYSLGQGLSNCRTAV